MAIRTTASPRRMTEHKGAGKAKTNVITAIAVAGWEMRKMAASTRWIAVVQRSL